MESGPSDDSLQDDDQYYLSGIKQRPPRLRAKRMKQLVNRLMASRGYGQVEAAGHIEQLWSEIVGGELAKTATPGRVYRGKLIVVVSDASSRQRLHFDEARILRRLQDLAPELGIRGLDIRTAQG